MIKGITITLISKVDTGKRDNFYHPIYEEKREEISDVLVAPASSADLPDNIDLSTTKSVYTMAIPKGDSHQWKGQEVEFFNSRWKVVGDVLEGIESNIPLRWNRKVTVEKCE